MDNADSQIDYDMASFKLMDFARKSVLVTNMALAESMGEGIFSEYEVFRGNGGILCMGVRPNSTAVAAAYSGKRILWSEIMLIREPELAVIHKLNVYEAQLADEADRIWVDLLDQIEEWVRCEREKIAL